MDHSAHGRGRVPYSQHIIGRPLRAAFVQGACGCLKAPAGHPGTSKKGKIIWNDFLWFKGTRSSLQLACCYSSLRQEPFLRQLSGSFALLAGSGRLLLLGAFDQPSPCKLLKNNSCWEKPGLRERKGPFLSQLLSCSCSREHRFPAQSGAQETVSLKAGLLGQVR